MMITWVILGDFDVLIFCGSCIYIYIEILGFGWHHESVMYMCYVDGLMLELVGETQCEASRLLLWEAFLFLSPFPIIQFWENEIGRRQPAKGGYVFFGS